MRLARQLGGFSPWIPGIAVVLVFSTACGPDRIPLAPGEGEGPTADLPTLVAQQGNGGGAASGSSGSHPGSGSGSGAASGSSGSGGWVSIQPDAVALDIGATIQLSAQVVNPAGRPIPNQRVEWALGSGDGVASVSAGGVVTALAPGIATVTATWTGGRSGSTVIVVNAPTGGGDGEASGSGSEGSGTSEASDDGGGGGEPTSEASDEGSGTSEPTSEASDEGGGTGDPVSGSDAIGSHEGS